MYYLKKTLEISGAHHLNLNYESDCKNPHGHNWKITVYCRSLKLDSNGMVVDFTTIKKIVNKLDHVNINEVFHLNPTAENISMWLCNQIPHCYRVTVQETTGNEVSYEKDRN